MTTIILNLNVNAHLYINKKEEIIMSTKFNKETFKLKGEEILKKIKELIEEGNVRKISIHDKTGKELMSFPLTIGVVGAVLAPVLAAVGALAALIGECTISVEREK
jgi:uncharacterized membrane protein